MGLAQRNAIRLETFIVGVPIRLTKRFMFVRVIKVTLSNEGIAHSQRASPL